MSKINAVNLELLTPHGRRSDPAEAVKTRYPYLMGVELELENVNSTVAPAGWVTHVDQSLRNGIEFVTGTPMAGSKLGRALASFYGSGITSRNSPRTSTHIHVNASDMNMGQLRTMFAVTYVVEAVLFDLIGRSRKYCGYCMPLREMSPARMRSFLTGTSWPVVNNSLGGRNEDKYYGFNINSVRKHGTVEFRYFAGGPSQAELGSWLDYCTGIKKLALNVSLEDFLNTPTPEVLVAVLGVYLGDWAAQLSNMQGPQVLFDALQELLAMFPDGDHMVREDELVFISDALMMFTKNYVRAKDDSPEWGSFYKEATKLNVMTQRAWMEMTHKLRVSVRNERAVDRFGDQLEEADGYDRMQPPRVSPAVGRLREHLLPVVHTPIRNEEL